MFPAHDAIAQMNGFTKVPISSKDYYVNHGFKQLCAPGCLLSDQNKRLSAPLVSIDVLPF